MRKILLIAVLLTLTSCEEMMENVGCGHPSMAKQAQAQVLLEQWSSFHERDISYEQGKKIFGCHYTRGDYIYSSKTLWATRYILVRHNLAVTYVEK